MRPLRYVSAPTSAPWVFRGMTALRPHSFTKLMPAFILSPFARQVVFLILEPETKPIKVALVNLIAMLRLVLVMKFVGVQVELHGPVEIVESYEKRQIAQPFKVPRLIEDRNMDAVGLEEKRDLGPVLSGRLVSPTSKPPSFKHRAKTAVNQVAFKKGIVRCYSARGANQIRMADRIAENGFPITVARGTNSLRVDQAGI